MAEGAHAFARRFGTKNETSHVSGVAVDPVGANAKKTLSAARILFGSVFLFDGILKWILIQQATMQDTVVSTNLYNIAFINNNWLAFGVVIALGETFGGIAMIAGLFQRPAALWSSGIMFAIFGVGGFGVYDGTQYSFVGYTDPGGDLMLALVFLVLVFTPYAYGIASRFRLREKWSGSSVKDRVHRFLVC